MPRVARFIVPDVAVHIVQRGHDGAPCFFDHADYVTYLVALATYAARFSCAVHAYCLMSNHVHLLVTEPERTNLSTAIQVIKQRFSRTRPEEFGWEPRYHDFNVFTEAKRIEKIRYMHRNPVKAGLVEEPDQWQWSSFSVYANQEDHPIQITTR